MRRKSMACAIATLVLTLLGSEAAIAGGLMLSLRETQGLRAGMLRNGTVLAEVHLAYQESHCGFLVWSDEQAVDGQPGRYALLGENAARQVLRVRLSGKDWRPDKEGGKGMILDGGKALATLEVVADGDQTVRAENWSLSLHSAATGCR